jgi:hypothetical protein
VSTHAFSQLLGREQAIRFNHHLLRMDPLGLDGVKPGTLGGQEERQDANAFPRLFDLLVVRPNPVPNHFAHMEGGRYPRSRASGVCRWRSQTLTTRLQKLNADCTHRTPSDKAQPDLRTVGIVRWSLLPQDAIAGQGLGVRIVLLPGLLHQTHGMSLVLPGVHARQGKAAPPDFVEETNGPIRLRTGPSNQAVACVFFSRYCGSGLVIQCLARFQLVFRRLRARRTLSSETSRGVSPCSKLTWAASWSVQTLLGLPKSRGLWWSRSCRASNASSPKVVRRRWGREDPSSKTHELRNEI